MKKVKLVFNCLLANINRWYKQKNCNHRWLQKGSPIDIEDAYFNQYRCPKCKKIKVVHFLK